MTKYILNKDSKVNPAVKAGSIVYELRGSDYGLARDDTAMLGYECKSVTLDPEGGYPSFSVPAHDLTDFNERNDARLAMKTLSEIQGKPLRGTIVNAEPYEVWPRCVSGWEVNRRTSVRTSLTEKLVIEDGVLYALTMNSAYRIDSMDLVKFLKYPEWHHDIQGIVGHQEGVFQVSREEFKKLLLSLSVGEWTFNPLQQSPAPRTLKIGEQTFIEGDK